MERIDYTKWASLLLCLWLGGGLFYLALRWLLPILLPFLIAWGISLCVTPLSKKLAKRTHVPQKLCSALLLLLFLAATAALIVFAVDRLTNEVRELVEGMLARYGSVEEMVSSMLERIEGWIASVGILDGAGHTAFREQLYGMLGEAATGMLSTLVAELPLWAGGILGALPSFLFSSVVCIIAAFYFCLERERITDAMISILPRAIQRRVPAWRAGMRRISWKYVKAYLLLLLLTLVLLFVGFSILGVPYAFLVAMLTAIVDMLPVFGIGTVLIPWAIVLLLQKNYYVAFGLLILYGICTLIRQIAEPRLVGKSLGLHPLLTVFATYVGWRLFGLFGMLIAPVLAVLGRSLLSQISGELHER